MRRWMLLAAAAALLSLPLRPARAHEHCIHASLLQRQREAIARSAFENAAARAKEAARQAGRPAAPPPPPAPPRVWLGYELSGFNGKPQAKAQIESDTMPTAVRVLQKLFKVRRPTAGNLLLPASWAASRCLDAAIDREFVSGLGRGRPVDFALHVTSFPCNGSAFAYAGACAVGGPDGRPVAGAINLCPGAFERLPARRQVEVVTHELLHAFGFSPALFPLYAGGDPRGPAPERPGARTALVRSPRVAEAARAHFGCPGLEGALLEDEGDAGSTGSHWEARLFQGELMLASSPFAGRADKPPRLALTMALLEDSGWYIPNYDQAAPLDFGAGAGCAFARGGEPEGSAAALSPGRRDGWYCRAGLQGAQCTYDHQAMGECFSPAAGQGPSFLNAAPMTYAYGAAANCRDAAAAAGEGALQAGQSRGASSLCYTLAAPAVGASGGAYGLGAGCWESSCTGGDLTVTFNLPGHAPIQHSCPTGAELDLAYLMPKHFSGGVLECPDNEVVCAAAPGTCGACAHGFCLRGTCHCDLMHTGGDCGTHVLQADLDSSGGEGAESTGGGSGLAADDVGPDWAGAAGGFGVGVGPPVIDAVRVELGSGGAAGGRAQQPGRASGALGAAGAAAGPLRGPGAQGGGDSGDKLDSIFAAMGGRVTAAAAPGGGGRVAAAGLREAEPGQQPQQEQQQQHQVRDGAADLAVIMSMLQQLAAAAPHPRPPQDAPAPARPRPAPTLQRPRQSEVRVASISALAPPMDVDMTESQLMASLAAGSGSGGGGRGGAQPISAASLPGQRSRAPAEAGGVTRPAGRLAGAVRPRPAAQGPWAGWDGGAF